MQQRRRSSSVAIHSTGWEPHPPPRQASMGVGHLLPASSPRARQRPSLPAHPVGPPCHPPPAHISQLYSSSPQPRHLQSPQPHHLPYQVSPCVYYWMTQALYFVCQYGFNFSRCLVSCSFSLLYLLVFQSVFQLAFSL